MGTLILGSVHSLALAASGGLPETQRQPAVVDLDPVAVDSSESADMRVTANVERTLLAGPYPMQSVAVVSSQGSVYLSGTVNSWHYKQIAQERTRRVQGVHRVINEIEVVPDVLPQK